MSNENSDNHPNPVVRLNVGGRKFDVLRSTLISGGAKDSMFAALLSESYSTPVHDHKGRIFIDRDSQTFARVLDWLRDGQLRDLDERLHRELCYFGIPAALETAPRWTSRFLCFAYWMIEGQSLNWVGRAAKLMLQSARKCHSEARPACCSEFIEATIEDLPPCNERFLTAWGQKSFCKANGAPGIQGFQPSVPMADSSLSVLTEKSNSTLYLSIAVVIPRTLPWDSFACLRKERVKPPAKPILG